MSLSNTFGVACGKINTIFSSLVLEVARKVMIDDDCWRDDKAMQKPGQTSIMIEGIIDPICTQWLTAHTHTHTPMPWYGQAGTQPHWNSLAFQ